MTNPGRVVALALAFAGVAAWGCGDDSQATRVTPGLEPASSSAPLAMAQAVVAQPPAPARLLRVAPQHLEAVQRGLARRLSRSSEGLGMHVAQDGSKSMQLKGRFGHVLIANQDEAGETQVQCAGSEEEVAKALGN